MILQVVVVFAMIALLALLLRWAFARDKRAAQWPPTQPEAESTDAGSAGGPSGEIPPVEAPSPDPWPGVDTRSRPFAADAVPSPTEAPAVEPEREDYGLLAEAAAVATTGEAERIRARLSAVGIRATTTIGRDGRHRVLVFASEIHRARRVAGGSGS